MKIFLDALQSQETSALGRCPVASARAGGTRARQASPQPDNGEDWLAPQPNSYSGPRIEPLSLEIHPIGVLLPGGGRSKPGDSSEFGFPSTAG